MSIAKTSRVPEPEREYADVPEPGLGPVPGSRNWREHVPKASRGRSNWIAREVLAFIVGM